MAEHTQSSILEGLDYKEVVINPEVLDEMDSVINLSEIRFRE